MSFARKCNRCGTYHDGRIYELRLEPPYLLDEDEKEYDLCPACKIEFEEFMNGVKPKDLCERLRALFRKGG